MISNYTVREFRVFRGWSQLDAADFFGVTVRTWRRWESSNKMPTAAGKLARLLCGDLGELNPDWSGWSLIQDQLCSPENQVYTVGWFRGLHFYFQRLRDERLEMANTIRDLKARLNERGNTDNNSSTVVPFRRLSTNSKGDL